MWQCNESEPAQWLRPDIENVWTVLAFFAPSALAVVALLIQYLLLHEPLAGSVPRDVNPVDVVVLRWVRSGLQYLGFGVHSLDHTGQEDGVRSAFDQFMLGLGDIHAGFGVAIIGHAFASLPRGLTAYDWWLTIGFGWAAVITNIAVLCSLRDYFRQNAVKRAWRLCLVFVMVATLAVCMVPVGRIRHAMHVSGQYNGHDILAANVLCFFPGRGHGVAAKQPSRLVLSWGLIVGFLIVVVALSATVMVLEHPEGVLKRWCRRYWEELEESSLEDPALCARCEHRFVLLVVRPFIAFWLMVRAHLDVLGSALTEIVCSVALCTWVSLRFYELLQLHPLHITDRLTLVHYIAFATLLATCKPLVEHACMSWRSTPRRDSSRRWPWSRNSESSSPSDDSETGAASPTINARLNTGKSVMFNTSAPNNAAASVQGDATMPRRRAMPRLPMHFKFYLDTAWYVAALPIAAMSCLIQLVLMLVLSTMGGMTGVDVIFKLMPWFVVFAPVQVFFYIIAAMIAEERGSSTQSRQLTFGLLSLGFVTVSTLSVMDTIYGLGGWPMSYLGLGALGLMVVAHVLYGCVSKPGRLVKGKGVNTGTTDEESALLGNNRNQPKIPVRRPKQLLPSRRLSKQGMKTYGTMMKPGN
ncbi:hypothetical protein PFICI_11331 [Pestalotiopsis fici W106-1]|uniref:Transmembrane protein n=1 Tax=Pestalotiopsis fici (strain W106-1 / CGMCC3.15140) TaxID=1229662 RepID=W3WWF6_PESFW|nr:uncharacterized protein PFICI_11331 [Pestalotiopsis fici W106-1]ETS77457.1 hypothetical protein PFICI_11331 [Pestalotiopsis fici W106-1]